MPRLPSDFSLVVADPRGLGASAKPEKGYDAGSAAGDLLSVMEQLGYERFALVGHDVGASLSCAAAADAPERILRLVLVEAALPGISEGPSILPDDTADDDAGRGAGYPEAGLADMLAGGVGTREGDEGRDNGPVEALPGQHVTQGGGRAGGRPRAAEAGHQATRERQRRGRSGRVIRARARPADGCPGAAARGSPRGAPGSSVPAVEALA